MILGMSTGTYILLHVLISLVEIGSGLVVMFGFLTGKRLDGWTALFLVTTVLTSVTGFGFPIDHLLPSHVIAIMSLVMLAVAISARYVFHLFGSFFFLLHLQFPFFVLVVQPFMKVPAVHALAPTQKEPPILMHRSLSC